jgi:peptidoglycan hydrolase-like protein with peptidoglycan-binding domain
MKFPARMRDGIVVVVALFISLTAGCGGLSGVGSTTSQRSGTSTTAASSIPPGTTVPSRLTTTVAKPPQSSTTTMIVPSRPIAPMLALGDSGSRVLGLQRRLAALGYWLGTPNGDFGDSTEQAVYALQKAAGIGRDGIVGPETETALARGVVPRPRSTSGHVVEVDLQDDLIMIVNGGKLYAVLNTSTGGGYIYVDDGVSAIALTPIGVFHVYREVDGLVTDSLGQLWRPKYFDDGFAIHGDSYVPPYPVSHGCVRVSNEAIDWIWANDLMPLGTEAWVYG